MNILGLFHLYPNEHMAGSETTVHAALRAMVQRRHQVTVVCDRSKIAPYENEGVQVIRPPRRGRQRWLVELAHEADLLVTHLDLTGQAMSLGLDSKRPLAHFIHNDGQLAYWHVNTLKCQLAIFNSDWVVEKQQWSGHQITIHPVVEPHRYVCERGEGVTLVNPTATKGSATFYALAQRFPDIDFITAQGGYNYQVCCPSRDDAQPIIRQHHKFYDETGSEQNCYGLPNVTHFKADPDIRNIFRRTRVLLMPSDYESYGRVGVEAACAGIPTIAHPTLGLKEAFGNAAIFCDREDVDSWAKEIDRLYTDEVYYRSRSDAALRLTQAFDPEREFNRLEAAFVATVERWTSKEQDDMAKQWTSDRRLYYTADGRITSDASKGVKLCCGVNGQISLDDAIKYGFVQPKTETTEPLLDTKALHEPPEDKAIHAPEATKATKKVRAA